MGSSEQTWVEGSVDAPTVYSLLKRKNAQYAAPAGNFIDVDKGISFLREIHEENYKQLLAPIISYFLNQLVAVNDKKGLQKQLGAFNAQTPPGVSIADYLARMVKYSSCSAECFIIALIFLDRLAQTQRVRLNSHNVHRFLLVSTLISAKILDDTTYNNKYYAHVGGIPVKELNYLECKLLLMLNHDLNLAGPTFDLYRYELEVQLLRQMYSESSVFTMEEMLKWERSEESETPTPSSPPLSRSKRVRRSRSFNSPVDLSSGCKQNLLLNKRKNRSISINIVQLPPATYTTS